MTTFFFRLIHCRIQNLCFGRVTVRFWWTSCKVVVTNCPSVLLIMSGYRQFNMLCGSQSKFVQVQQFFYWFIIDNWWLVGSSKCYIYFAKCCGQFVLKFSTEVLCQGRLFCLNFSQNILNLISTCILEKWAKARMSSLICSFLW